MKKEIKELHKLVDLCMEINEKTKHQTRIEIEKINGKAVFDVIVYENEVIELYAQKTLARIEKITLPNINECRQKLLKYKE